MKLLWRMGILLLSVVTWAVLTTPSAWAGGVVGTGTPASCDSNDLEEALEGGGTVTFNCGTNPLIIVADTYIIEDDTTIIGDGLITLTGEESRQIFIIDNDAILTLYGITLANGESASGGCASINVNGALLTYQVTFRNCRDTSTLLGGGAVYNLGTFTATETTFESNEATWEGGAVFNRGTFNASFTRFEDNSAGEDSGAIENDANGVAIIEDSAFIGNTAQDDGGALGNSMQGEELILAEPLVFPEANNGSFTIRRTLFVDNSAESNGGAINNVVGSATIENSTFVRNTATQGGAIFSEGDATAEIRFSTFFDNRADFGGAIYRPLIGTVELGFSILAGSRSMDDTTPQLECDGPALVSLGYNLIEDGSCVSGSEETDIRNTPPGIGPLQDNRGFSMTMLPEAGSPGSEEVPARFCPERDQRFAKRIGACDIGAAERGGLFESAYLIAIWKAN